MRWRPEGMPKVRFSIAWAMGAIAIVGLDLAYMATLLRDYLAIEPDMPVGVAESFLGLKAFFLGVPVAIVNVTALLAWWSLVVGRAWEAFRRDHDWGS